MPDGIVDCVLGARNQERIDNVSAKLTEAIKSLHEVDENQWQAINHIHDRLPPWAAMMMTALGAIAGATLGGLMTLIF